MQPADIFNELMKKILSLLKEYNYKRYRGNVFYTSQQGNWGFIGFQKSVSSNRYEILFAINLEIYSKILMNFSDSEKTPSIYECKNQWNYRIGHLVSSYGYDWLSMNKLFLNNLF